MLVRVYDEFEYALLCYADYCRPLQSIRVSVDEDRLVSNGEVIVVPVRILIDCPNLEAVTSDKQIISEFFRKFDRGELIFKILVVSYDYKHPTHTLRLRFPAVK